MLRLDLPGVRENVPLKNHTTFNIGGPARYFCIANTSEDIENTIEAAKKHNVPYLLLSGGSNVLVSEKGYPGLVIKIQNTRYEIRGTKVWAESGVSMDTLVQETTQRGLAGLEWAGGLPGTVGGAVRGNAGAFGGETKDRVVQVDALDARGKRTVFSKQQCRFAYRSSVFKKKNLVVLSATFQLQKGNAKELQAVAKEHIAYRKTRHPLEYPNAGSIFKNCGVKSISKTLQKQWKDVVKKDPFPVVPTAFILAEAGVPGMRVGGAEVSTKHPNYIVNKGNATAQDVLRLIEQVKADIQKKYNIVLEPEIQYVS